MLTLTKKLRNIISYRQTSQVSKTHKTMIKKVAQSLQTQVPLDADVESVINENGETYIIKKNYIFDFPEFINTNPYFQSIEFLVDYILEREPYMRVVELLCVIRLIHERKFTSELLNQFPEAIAALARVIKKVNFEEFDMLVQVVKDGFQVGVMADINSWIGVFIGINQIVFYGKETKINTDDVLNEESVFSQNYKVMQAQRALSQLNQENFDTLDGLIEFYENNDIAMNNELETPTEYEFYDYRDWIVVFDKKKFKEFFKSNDDCLENLVFIFETFLKALNVSPTLLEFHIKTEYSFENFLLNMSEIISFMEINLLTRLSKSIYHLAARRSEGLDLFYFLANSKVVEKLDFAFFKKSDKLDMISYVEMVFILSKCTRENSVLVDNCHWVIKNEQKFLDVDIFWFDLFTKSLFDLNLEKEREVWSALAKIFDQVYLSRGLEFIGKNRMIIASLLNSFDQRHHGGFQVWAYFTFETTFFCQFNLNTLMLIMKNRFELGLLTKKEISGALETFGEKFVWKIIKMDDANFDYFRNSGFSLYTLFILKYDIGIFSKIDADFEMQKEFFENFFALMKVPQTFEHAELHSLNFLMFLFSLEYLYFSNQIEIYEKNKKIIQNSLNFVLRESSNLDLSSVLLNFLKGGHLHLKIGVTDQILVFARRKLHKEIISSLGNPFPEDILNFFKLQILTQAPLFQSDIWELAEYQLLEKLDQFTINQKIRLLRSLISYYFSTFQKTINKESSDSEKDFEIIFILVDSIISQISDEAPFEYQEFLKLKFDFFEDCLEFLGNHSLFTDAYKEAFDDLMKDYENLKTNEFDYGDMSVKGYKNRLIILNEKKKLEFEWEAFPDAQFDYWSTKLFKNLRNGEKMDFEVGVHLLMDFYRYLFYIKFTSFTKSHSSFNRN